MSPEPAPHMKFRVLIAGGGVAALEALLALHELASERLDVTMLAPNDEFVYRPMTVREPFGYLRAARYPLAAIAADVGADLVKGELASVDPVEQAAHTDAGQRIPYDALIVALGGKIAPRFEHAVTIDDRRMDEALHGLIQDVEEGYLDSVAFVAPGRMAWPLPLYELALMTAGRAYDMGVELEATLITPEEAPLGIFGEEVSDGVAGLLAKRDIRTITSAYAEIPRQGEIVIHPGERRIRAKRVIALPELFGPALPGLQVGEHGFIHVDRFCRVPHSGPVFAAGDAVDFPVKQGGIGAQQADRLAESVAALAGLEIDPAPFDPVLHGVLLTDEQPRYIAARITGGHGFTSRFSDTPLDDVTHKIAAQYLGPYLERLDAIAVGS